MVVAFLSADGHFNFIFYGIRLREMHRRNHSERCWAKYNLKVTSKQDNIQVFKLFPPHISSALVPFFQPMEGKRPGTSQGACGFAVITCLHQVFRVTFIYCPFSCLSLEISTEITNISLNSSLRLEVDHRLHSDVSVIIVFFWCPTLNTMERFKNIIQWIYHHGHLKYGHRR